MLKRESLSEKLTKIISNQIIKNELKSGEIISEGQIAKEWGTSRSPVRDALNLLVKEMLVEKGPKGIYKVTELNLEYIENFYDAVSMFYQYSLQRATTRMTTEDIKFILATTRNIEISVDDKDFEGYVRGVTTFARTVLQVAQNAIIERSALDLMPTLERVLYAAVVISPGHLHKSKKYVKKIYDNLSGKNQKNVGKAFQGFTNTSRDVLLNYFKAENTQDRVVGYD